MHPTLRDGPYCFTDNNGCAPNYFPNSFSDYQTDSTCKEHCVKLTGDVQRFNTNEDNFGQVTDFWTNVLLPDERERLVRNIADSLRSAEVFIQERAVQNFEKVHADFGAKLRLALNLIKVGEHLVNA